jgi:hypothetical protein
MAMPNPLDPLSRELVDADYTEQDRDTGEDHAAHAAGRYCKLCDRRIEAGQAARRRGETGWVHDVCPIDLNA